MAEQKKNEAFYFKIEGDGEDRFSRCFWADASSRRAYRLYGDVVVFDTTFNTNRYDLTFAPILGVNNHGQTIVLACTFLSKETTESFIWMFEEFKKAMQAHSACKEYWREFQKAIWDTDNKDEFDAKWNIVVTKAGLTDHQWLSSMFDLRESWVPAYRQKELAADHVDAFEVAQCILLMPMNKQMATLYTRAMFQKFEKELIQSTACFLELKTEDASKVVFNIEYMPDKYILKRWKKTAKAGLVSDANGNEIKDSADPGLLIKRSTMSRLASDVVEDALMCEEGCELVSETLKSLRVKLKLLKDGPSNNEVGGSSSQTQYMKDPKRVRCKGKWKQVTGAKEKLMKRGIRHCRECGDIGHDRRQCPRNLNTP
ncbi:hypothetical protein ACE6H2_002283 [Prunus campanulata]